MTTKSPQDQAATASMIYGLGGAVTGAVQAYYQSQAQRQALRMQASVDSLNADIATLQAEQVLFGGRRDEARARGRGLTARGKGAVAIARSGTDIRSDSALAMLDETDLLSEEDAQAIRAQAESTAAGVRIGAIQGRLNASIGRSSANTFNPGLSGLSMFGAQGAQVAQRWYTYQSTKG